MRNYIRYIRKQPKHVQHVHAFVFAGAITAIIAGSILYMEYGFWRDRYIRGGEQETIVQDEPPSQILSRFWSEAKKQVSNVGSSNTSFFEGKESYVSEPKEQ